MAYYTIFYYNLISFHYSFDFLCGIFSNKDALLKRIWMNKNNNFNGWKVENETAGF